MRKNYIFLVFIFFLSVNVGAQKEPKQEIEKLLAKADSLDDKKLYIEALKVLSRGELLAKKDKLSYFIPLIKNRKGNIYKILSNYGEALTSYTEALNLISQLPDSDQKEPILLNNIGSLYKTEGDLETALLYFNKAREQAIIAKSTDHTKVMLAINLSNVHNNLEQPQKAQFYLDEVKTLPKDEFFEQMWTLNYGESFLKLHKYDQAKRYITKVISDTTIISNVRCYTCASQLLSKLYSAQQNYTKAITIAKKGLYNTKELNDQVVFYSTIAHNYYLQKSYQEAYQYKDSVVITKAALNKKVNRSLYESNKVKLNIQEYKAALQLNKERQASERRVFIIVLVFSLIVFYALYRGIRNRMIKQKQAKELIANREKITRLELEKEKNGHEAIQEQAQANEERLKNKIALKNRKLSTKALYMSERNLLIEEIINSLAAIPEIATNPKVKTDIKTLKQQLKGDDEWSRFIKHFEEINPQFFKVLKEKHPKLNIHDIRFLCYLYMNLDLKEISIVMGITFEASKKRKQRIAKKMNLSTDNLRAYLFKLG